MPRSRPSAVLRFFQEQWEAMKLTKAVATCKARGHEEGQTLLWKERYVVVCPRCGTDLG